MVDVEREQLDTDRGCKPSFLVAWRQSCHGHCCPDDERSVLCLKSGNETLANATTGAVIGRLIKLASGYMRRRMARTRLHGGSAIHDAPQG